MKQENNKFNAKFKSFFPTEEEWWKLKEKYNMRGASLQQTMGPHYKDIYWTPHPLKVNKRPYVIINKK